MSHSPRDGGVTVVIPAYNRQDTIGRAVLSALEQSTPPAGGVIVVDDGSVDRTGANAAAAGAIVVQQSNQGESAARNAALRACTTRWAAFLDSDDEWLPNHLELLLGQARDGVVLVASNARGVPSGRLVGRPGNAVRTVTSLQIIWPESPLATSATMVAVEPALSIGGFSSIALGEDRDFWCRILELGRGVLVPDVTVKYHEHAGQISSNASAMRSARTSLLGSLAERSWFDRGVLRKVAVVSAWDELRAAARRRDLRAAVAAARELSTNRYTVSALVETLRWRRALRELSESS